MCSPQTPFGFERPKPDEKMKVGCWLLKIRSMVKYKKSTLTSLLSCNSTSIKHFMPKVSDGFFQTFPQRNLRHPAEQLFRTGNVGLPLLRIVLGQRLENNFARRSDHTNDLPRKLQHGHFVRVSNVHRQRSVTHHQPIDAFDQIGTVTKTARLTPVTKNSHRLVLESLADKC